MSFRRVFRMYFMSTGFISTLKVLWKYKLPLHRLEIWRKKKPYKKILEKNNNSFQICAIERNNKEKTKTKTKTTNVRAESIINFVIILEPILFLLTWFNAFRNLIYSTKTWPSKSQRLEGAVILKIEKREQALAEAEASISALCPLHDIQMLMQNNFCIFSSTKIV